MKTYTGILTIFLFALIFSANRTAAQTKTAKPFFVPCAKALNLSVEKLEVLYDAEMHRRSKGNTDSGTENAATIGALKNYISCRRAKTAAEIKNFSDRDAAAELKRFETTVKSLAKMRFDDLIYGVSWDETGADSINYPMTLSAVALVEDFRGTLAYVYGQNSMPAPLAFEKDAETDLKTIEKLLTKMENRQFEDASDASNYKAKFAKFKTAVKRFLADNADTVPPEKAAAADFIVKLLELGTAEN